MAARRDRGDRRTEQQRKIFIGGLHYQTTDDSLRSFYEKWGEVVDCVVMVDPATRRSRGFGFITFSSEESVDNCLTEQPHIIDGKEVEPKRAVPRDESVPSARGGGGSSSGGGGTGIKKLFVGGIGQDTDEEQLRSYFARFGQVESASVMTDKDTGKSRGFGFVVFEDYDAVDTVCQTRMHDINGHKAEVKRAVPRNDDSLAQSGGRRGRGAGGPGGRMSSYGGPSGGGYGNGYGGGAAQYGSYGSGGAAAAYGGATYGTGAVVYGTAGASTGYPGYGASAYGAYGSTQNAAYSTDISYGAGRLGSGYEASYGGGPMKSAGYAGKSAGPYGGGYGAGAGAQYGGAGGQPAYGYGAGAASNYSAPAAGGGAPYGGAGYGGY